MKTVAAEEFLRNQTRIDIYVTKNNKKRKYKKRAIWRMDTYVRTELFRFPRPANGPDEFKTTSLDHNHFDG